MTAPQRGAAKPDLELIVVQIQKIRQSNFIMFL